MKIKSVYIGVILLIIASPLFAQGENDDDVLRAMRDEIARSMDLHVKDLKKPYYVEYTVRLTNSNVIQSTLGDIIEKNFQNTATLNVGLRVGDYKFDNTNFFDIGLSFFGSGDDEENFKHRTIPVELDYNTLRRELWLATDAAYKQSAELFSKKEAAMQNRLRKDTTHDFLKVPPEKNYDRSELVKMDKDKYITLLKEISAIFDDYPGIDISYCGLEYIPEKVYYVNSEGMEYIKSEYYTGLEMFLAGQSDDGMPIMEFFTAYGKIPDDLPKADSLKRAAKIIAEKFIKLKKAGQLDDSYSGPVIFEQQAAAEIFAQVFAPDLVAQRQPMTENGMQDRGPYAAFQTKVGGRVLPEFLSVNADPKLDKTEGTKLLGSYNIDDEGVKSEKVNLVKDGYLKNLLSSRVPTKRIRKSNGHERGGAPMLSVLRLSSKKENITTDRKLKKRLMKLCKDRELPYGIIVRKVMNQNLMYTTLFRLTKGRFQIPRNNTSQMLLEVYKLYPDGHEELLRGTESIGITVQSFKDILLLGDKNYVMNYLAPAVVSPFYSGGKQYVGASIITPDILFEDCEIKPVDGDFPKPPILANPVGK